MTGRGGVGRKAAVAWLGLLLCACSLRSRGPVTLDASDWEGALRSRGVDPGTTVNPIAITPEMRAFAEEHGRGSTRLEQLARLQSALFDPANFTFDYDSKATLTAREAFERRRGNCVAFTNLFIALARSRGILVRLAFAIRDPSSERSGDLVFVNNHVIAAFPYGSRVSIYDFYQLRRDEVVGVRLLDDFWIAAVYHNNLAVSLLREGDLASAGRQLERTVTLAPEFAGAWGNLGVVRRRLGDVDGALEAYRRSLAIAPRDPAVLYNLAGLYAGLGREREARAAMDAADLSKASPYTLIVRGDLEASAGRLDEALDYYKRAKRIDPKLADAWLAIARVQIERNRPEEALRAANRALSIEPENSAAREIRERLSPTSREALP